MDLIDRFQKIDAAIVASKSIVISFGRRYLCKDCFERLKLSEENTEDVEPDIMDVEPEISMELFENDAEPIDVSKKEEEELTPKQIVEYLDKYVIGQEKAKKTLAVAVFNHWRRIHNKNKQVKIPKCNVLMRGATGTGKTYLLKKIAEFLDVLFYVVDASTLTESGYKGNNPDTIISGLHVESGYSLSRTQKAVVFLDEADKLSTRFGHSADANKSTGAGVQRQLLKMIEGCTIDFKLSEKHISEPIRIDTDDILFICGGAFVGIDECKESTKMQKIGFCVDSEAEKTDESVRKSEENLTPEDFINYGFIPEIIGRLPMIVSLHDLSESDIRDILLYSEESIIRSYQETLKEYGVSLIFEPEAIDEIAHQAYIRDTGARGINAVVENIMRDLMYEIPSDSTIRRCTITKEVVQGINDPVIEYQSKETVKG